MDDAVDDINLMTLCSMDDAVNDINLSDSEDPANEFANTPYFHINKSGFPLDEDTWLEMWRRVRVLHPDGKSVVIKIQTKESHPAVPLLVEPKLSLKIGTREKIDAIQKYLNKLEYNHTGTQFFQIKMNRPIAGLTETAKEIMRSRLPIKCLEAVIVGLYLSSGVNNILRFTIRFKSKFEGHTYRHIVLGIYGNFNYGTLGLSRRDTLMYKPLEYKTLPQLIFDFRDAYKDCCHQLVKVKFSTPIPKDVRSVEKVYWDYFTVPLGKLTEEEIKASVEKYSRTLRSNQI